MSNERDDESMDELMERVWDRLEEIAADLDARDGQPTSNPKDKQNPN